MPAVRPLALLALVLLMACRALPSSHADAEENEVKVNTASGLAWEQYRANAEFVRNYEPRCSGSGSRPRVLVTGFGRFMSNTTNASGMIVSQFLPELAYPESSPPAAGQIDPPAAQLAVALGTRTLPRTGEVDVCAMVLPVFWDTAALVVLAEIEAFEPDLVVMNGIAGSVSELWLELGAINRADGLADGSSVLMAEPGPVIASAGADEFARANLLSWLPVRTAMQSEISARADQVHDGRRFDGILPGAHIASYPRTTNTYLCNNTTYAVGYVMDHPGEAVTLLEPSVPRDGDAGIVVVHSEDRSFVPRVFIHWPSELDGAHLKAAADVLTAGIDAQMAILFGDGFDDWPTRGDNKLADF